MKKLSLILAVLFSISLVIMISCDDDEDNPGTTGPVNAELEETIWVLQSRVAVNCDDPDENENVTCDEECNVIRVNTDGTITIADNEGIFPVPYTKSGNSLTVDIGDNETMDVTYVITGNTMTVTFTEDGCNITEVYNASTESLDLVGTLWTLKFESRENCTDANNDCDDCDFDPFTITFNADGTTEGSSIYQYSVSGNILTMDLVINGDSVTSIVEYQIISDIMMANFGDYVDTNGFFDSCEITQVFRGWSN